MMEETRDESITSYQRTHDDERESVSRHRYRARFGGSARGTGSGRSIPVCVGAIRPCTGGPSTSRRFWSARRRRRFIDIDRSGMSERHKFDITLPMGTRESFLPRSEDLTARQPVTVFDATDPEPLLRVDSTYPEAGTFIVQWDYNERIEISTDIPWSRDPFSSFLIFTNLQEESLNHPDQFYFGEMGWLTTEDVAARDGVDLLTICTPRPK